MRQTTDIATTPGIRESLEALEASSLHAFAVKSGESAGRQVAETPCPLRTAFQRDRDRILHSKAFRRLKHKTQVFISPRGDHFRTRLTHTLEVSQVSRTIARALRLNEDLTEAVALGHDLGHPPFGHAGEDVLARLHPGGFRHERQSVRIASRIEPMNLTREVLEGIADQAGAAEPATLEARVVKIADRMAYLRHDMEDAIRAGLIAEQDVPAEITAVLGTDREARLDRMVGDLVETTRRALAAGERRIAQSAEVAEAMGALRKWMFRHVYLAPETVSQKARVERILTALYEYYCAHPEAISPNIPDDDDAERRVIDYIAGMTDRYAVTCYSRAFLPHAFQPGFLEIPEEKLNQ